MTNDRYRPNGNQSMKLKILFIVTLAIIPSLLWGSAGETLPSWHWAYSIIGELRMRGGFEELWDMNRPWTRGEIARGVVRFRERFEGSECILSAAGLTLLEKLEAEFAPEIRGEQDEVISAGVHLRANVDGLENDDTDFNGVYRSRITVAAGKRLTVSNAFVFDQYKVDDPLYVGKKWRGLAGYGEQAYLSGAWKRIRVKFGRDFLRWGAGENGTLLFSDIARPMDQFAASGSVGPFRFTFLASLLDDMTWADSTGSHKARRYISAHRLDVKLLGGRLQAAVTEAVIYGGENRQMEWVYLNPFLFYHGVQLNDNRPGNTLGTADVIFYPLAGWKLYGSFLTDDIQVEKTGSGDLEPAEIGWIIGGQKTDPFGLAGMTISAEYAGIKNRTYQTLNLWESFIHRNDPLGHPLGNDFDHLRIDVSQWFGSLWIQACLGIARNGEESIRTPFDTPWSDIPVNEGYSEPFPTGIVEKQSSVGLKARWFPSIHWGIEGDLEFIFRKNAGHIEDETGSDVTWRIGVWWDGEIQIKL